MNLNWGFFYDSWLIDEIPDILEIRSEEHPDGWRFNPSELTMYFGANPIYLYGEGKLFHEVLMCPSGISIHPQFLERPGFEFIDDITFSVEFPEEYDFDGELVNDLHVGYIDATEYLKSIMEKLYGVGKDSFTKISTASSRLRKLTSDDKKLQELGINNDTVFLSAEELGEAGCVCYMRMEVDRENGGIVDEIKNETIYPVTENALIQGPGTFSNVLFMKYCYINAPQAMVDAVAGKEFQILFSTTPGFRYGEVFNFGCTKNSNTINYGFQLDIYSDYARIVMNDGNFNEYYFMFENDIDFRLPNRFMITRTSTSLQLSINGRLISFYDVTSNGYIIYDSDLGNYISGSHYNSSINNQSGDLEEVTFFNRVIDVEKYDLSKYTAGNAPVLYRGGVDQAVLDIIPVGLSYDLTYSKPTKIVIPNFFGGLFKKIYLSDELGDIKIIPMDGDWSSDSSYLIDSFDILNKDMYIPVGYSVYSATTFNEEPLYYQDVKTKIPVLTKLTSDTHIPIKIHIKFKYPEFYDMNITYNMSMVVSALSNFLVYDYRKFKTGEFV